MRNYCLHTLSFRWTIPPRRVVWIERTVMDSLSRPSVRGDRAVVIAESDSDITVRYWDGSRQTIDLADSRFNIRNE